MANYILSGESTCDLSHEHLVNRDIHYIMFHFSLGDGFYPDDLGQSIPFPEFYKRMEEGEMTKTSQITIGEFLEYFEPFLKEGKDILHITLSSGLSGDYQCAVEAARELMEKYPERKIYIVDSRGASSGFGLLLDKLADKRDEGLSVDELHEYAEENKLRVHHWFFSTDLKYYVRGGRVSKTSGFLGNLLHICPLLNMDEPGHLIPREKVHGIKKVEERIVQMMEAHAIDGLDYSDKVYISQSACLDYAEAVANKVEERFAKKNGKVEINWIGTTIGAHTGPGTVALFFWGDKRAD
ncbi:MAG: DegV family protein [Bacilli bacterium]|nr:DegV family protein [Bacilli bacterium]